MNPSTVFWTGNYTLICRWSLLIIIHRFSRLEPLIVPFEIPCILFFSKMRCSILVYIELHLQLLGPVCAICLGHFDTSKTVLEYHPTFYLFLSLGNPDTLTVCPATRKTSDVLPSNITNHFRSVRQFVFQLHVSIRNPLPILHNSHSCGGLLKAFWKSKWITSDTFFSSIPFYI